MKISIITPYRKRKGQFENLKRLIKNVRGNLPLIKEIIISEYGIHDKRIDSIGNVKILKEDTNEIWNRSKAINLGMKNVKGDVFLVLDSDCIPLPNLDEVLLELHKRFGVIFLWPIVNGFLDTNSVGNLSITEYALSKIGRWDEKFKGYGREDKDIEYKIIKSGMRYTYLPFFIKKDDRKTPSRFTEKQKKCWEKNKIYFNKKHGKNAFEKVHGKRVRLKSSFFDFWRESQETG